MPELTIHEHNWNEKPEYRAMLETLANKMNWHMEIIHEILKHCPTLAMYAGGVQQRPFEFHRKFKWSRKQHNITVRSDDKFHAAVIYMFGDIVHTPGCEECLVEGKAVFPLCVGVEGMRHGACAHHSWYNQGAECQFNRGSGMGTKQDLHSAKRHKQHTIAQARFNSIHHDGRELPTISYDERGIIKDKNLFKAIYTPTKLPEPYVPPIFHDALNVNNGLAPAIDEMRVFQIQNIDTYDNLCHQRRHLVEAADLIRTSATIHVGGVVVQPQVDEGPETFATRLALARLQYAHYMGSVEAYIEARYGIHVSYYAPPPDITDAQLAEGFHDY